MLTTPDDLVLAPDATLAEAQRLLVAGCPFHAHEVLEAGWKAAPVVERDLWQGLAQLAVGITHARRGNAAGAVRLLLRAADRIAPDAAGAPYGVPVAALVDWARQLAGRIATAGLAAVPGSDLVPRLTTDGPANTIS